MFSQIINAKQDTEIGGRQIWHKNFDPYDPFTIEGSLYGIMALAAGAIYGIPLLSFTAAYGISIPEMSQNIGLAIGAKIYPAYGVPLLVSTSVILFVAVVIVSYLPTAHLKPTDAIREKM